MFNTIEDIKAANTGRGFFQPSAMRYFRSRVSSRIYPRPHGGAYFVTSERELNAPRLYTVREATPDGRCHTAPGLTFQCFSTARAAHRWAAEFCKETNR